MGEAAPVEILRPLLLLWMLVLALYPLARKLAGDIGWAGILLTIFVFGFYFEQNYFVIVVSLVAAVLLILLGSCMVMKRRFQVSYLSWTLTLMSVALLAVQSTILFSRLNSIPRAYYDAMAARTESLAVPLQEPASGIKPDIYYIVVDNYPGKDVLKDFLGYDNSAFLNNLKDLGFVVPEEVLSNYPRTALSISSTLDMQYWESIAPDMENVTYWWPTRPVLEHSRVRASLEAIGYQSVSVASDWQLTNNATTDQYLKPFPVILTQYEDLIVTSTALRILHSPFQEIAPVRNNDTHRRFFAYEMEILKQLPKMQGPKFIFVHILPPHPPFVFHADGSPIDSDAVFRFGHPVGISKEQYREHYIEHVEYVNGELKSVLKTILEKSTTPPIIILQADHGSATSISFDSVEVGCLKERFSALGAYYLPGKQPGVIPQDMTAVNLFRIVLNEYFGADLSLLENHQYFTKGNYLFAGMQEVSERVQNGCRSTPATK
jgi:hypothetical protein